MAVAVLINLTQSTLSSLQKRKEECFSLELRARFHVCADLWLPELTQQHNL